MKRRKIAHQRNEPTGGMTVTEIGAKLKISPQAVFVILARALEKLKANRHLISQEVRP